MRSAAPRLFLFAMVAMLGSTPLASAFPIQNITDTDIPGDLGAGVNLVLRGSVVASVGWEGKSFYVGGFTTKTLRVDNADTNPASGNQGEGYQGNLIFTGTGAVAQPAGTPPAGGYYSYRTFCMELTETVLTTDAGVRTTIETVPPVGHLDQNGNMYVSNSPAALRRAAWVVAYAADIATGSLGTLSDKVQQAAIQLAVWEIMYEAGTTSVGDVLGSVGDKFYTTTTKTDQAQAAARANQLLAASFGKVGQGFVLRQNFGFNYKNLDAKTYYKYGKGQDLLVGVKLVVPEPSSLAIAALGLVGLCGHGWLRRRPNRA